MIYKYSRPLNGYVQVITEVEFECMPAMQGVYHVLHPLNKHRHLANDGLVNLNGGHMLHLF